GGREADGYVALAPPGGPRRRVGRDRAARALDIIDEIDRGGHDVPLAFHLGPAVSAELDGTGAVLRWPGAASPGAARLALPAGLAWSLHRGETNPILGWYSSGLERRGAPPPPPPPRPRAGGGPVPRPPACVRR